MSICEWGLSYFDMCFYLGYGNGIFKCRAINWRKGPEIPISYEKHDLIGKVFIRLPKNLKRHYKNVHQEKHVHI